MSLLKAPVSESSDAVNAAESIKDGVTYQDFTGSNRQSYIGIGKVAL